MVVGAIASGADRHARGTRPAIAPARTSRRSQQVSDRTTFGLLDPVALPGRRSRREPPRVAVIGGGLAGLAAAARLAASRRDACACSSATPTWVVWCAPFGATAGSSTWARRWPPNRPPACASCLMRPGSRECTLRAGPAAATRYIVLDGKPVPAAAHHRRIFVVLAALARRSACACSRSASSRRGRDPTDESVDSFARRRFGDEMAERAVRPARSRAPAPGDPQQIIARYAFPALVGHERRVRFDACKAAPARAWRRVAAARGARPAAGVAPTACSSCRGNSLAIGTVRTGTPVDRVAANGRRRRALAIAGAERRSASTRRCFAVPAPALGRHDN